MNFTETTGRDLVLAATLFWCSPAVAQVDLRPLASDTQPPFAATKLDALRFPALAQQVVLMSTATAKPRQLHGVFGALQLDLTHLTAIVLPPGGDVEACKEQLRRSADAGAPIYYQVLRDSADGPSLSSLRQAGEDPALTFRQQDSMDVCQARAEKRIAEVTGTGMAGGWRGQPRIVAVTALHRPDVEGVAYFEFKVDQGGFLITATGEHDRPITNWSSVGPTRSEVLNAQAKNTGASIARIYKIDTLCYLAESAAEQVVARVGTLPLEIHGLPARVDQDVPASVTTDSLMRREWTSWRALKQGYAETYRPLLRQMKERFAASWQIERPVGPAPQADWGPWYDYWADGGSSQQPIYYQMTYGSCAVGCGPVAWTMLFCWGDYQAHHGNAYWSARTGLYQTNGGTSGTATCAPLYQSWDYGVENVMKELNRDMDTWCSGSSGATWPSRMDDAKYYLSGRTGATCAARGSDIGWNADSYREDARDSIVDRDTPAIIGTGFLSHYPLAFGYAWRSKTNLWGTTYDRLFYVNQGWGSSTYFEWVDAGTFLVGELFH